MKTITKSILNLGLLRNLIVNKEFQLNDMITKIHKTNVDNESAYRRTLNHLRNNLLLRKVVISQEGIIVDHSNAPNGAYAYLVDVAFDLNTDASIELFSCRTGEGGTVVGSPLIYQPFDGKIHVTIATNNLDKKGILDHANNAISLTRKLIDTNNAEIESWVTTFEKKIEQKLEVKRDEIMKLYK